MVRAIVRKDLRETRLFAFVSLGLYLFFLSNPTGSWMRVLSSLVDWIPGLSGTKPDVPFVQGDFLSVFLFIGVGLAIALGFRQSTSELSQGTALYLLHLPLPRRTIYSTKILTGIGVLLTCTLVPILIYGTWASMPRTHPGPFEWSMTEPAFHIWMILPLAYLGAFASGIQPTRWFGSRLLPLVAVVIPGIVVSQLPYWWLIAFPLLLVVEIVFFAGILWQAETRDY